MLIGIAVEQELQCCFAALVICAIAGSEECVEVLKTRFVFTCLVIDDAQCGAIVGGFEAVDDIGEVECMIAQCESASYLALALYLVDGSVVFDVFEVIFENVANHYIYDFRFHKTFAY